MLSDIQILKHHQINKQKWDDCINHSLQGIIYALSWYLDIVSPKWEALVVTNNGEYEVVMPVPIRKKLGVKFVHQPFFCQQLGIFSRNKPDETMLNSFLLVFINSYFYTPQYVFNCQNNISYQKLHIKAETLFTHYLTLDKSYREIFKSFKRDRKYRIKQAKKKNSQIQEGKSIDPLINIFKDDTVRKIQGGVHESTFKKLKNLFQKCSERGLSEIYYIKNERGEAECGAWFVKYKGKIIYLFNASTRAARIKNGRSLILDHIIKKYQNSDLVLDFESPEKPEIASFYLSFGSEAIPFQSIYFNNSPEIIKSIHQIKIYLHRKVLKLKP